MYAGVRTDNCAAGAAQRKICPWERGEKEGKLYVIWECPEKARTLNWEKPPQKGKREKNAIGKKKEKNSHLGFASQTIAEPEKEKYPQPLEGRRTLNSEIPRGGSIKWAPERKPSGPSQRARKKGGGLEKKNHK